MANLAVLLKNGNGQQVLPVSKSNLIELLSSTYNGYFNGKIAQADVDSALAYIAGTYIPGVAAEAKNYTETKINGLSYTAEAAPGKAVVAVTEDKGIIAPVQGDVYSEYVKYDGAENSTSLKSYLDALTAKDAAIITSYEAADSALGERINNLSTAKALKLTKGAGTTADSAAATGDNLKIGNDGATYKLWQGTTQVAEFTFNEKDSFVESGVTRQATPEDVTAAGGESAPFKAGDWIIALTLKVLTNQGETETKTVYIPAESLVDAYTSGSANDDMVVIGINQKTNKITASLTDGKVTKVKLEQHVQDSLGLADTALQDVTLNNNSIVTDKIAKLTVSVGDTAGSIKINDTNYVPKDLKTIATSGLASDAVVKREAGSELAKLAGASQDTTDTNVQASLEALAGKVNTIQGGMVTNIDGGAYNKNGVEITLDTNNNTGDVTVSVASSNLNNVATLHYDSVNATTEDFALYSIVNA